MLGETYVTKLRDRATTLLARRRYLTKSLSFRAFVALDRLRLHVLPKHFYTPVPDYTWLKRNMDTWTHPLPVGDLTEWDLDAQLGWLREVCEGYYDEVAGLRTFADLGASNVGPGFGPIESQVLHCVVRARRPRRILEIGSGLSTACMLNAIELNARDGGERSEVVCIEPYPKPAFRDLPGLRHIEELCQTVDGNVFEQLESGDMLFVDSSHSVKIGSDVVRIYLDVIPRLRPGVLVHVHDVNLPYAYPRDALSAFWASQETALLLALLAGNRSLRVSACCSALHYGRREALREVLPDYQPAEDRAGLPRRPGGAGHFPSSIWLETV